MSRCDRVCTVSDRGVKQCAELELFVAGDAGVGGTARLVYCNEFVDDGTAECIPQIVYPMGNAERVAYCPSVTYVIGFGRSFSRIGAVKCHGRTRHAVAGRQQQMCDNRGIHAAAHGGKNMSAHGETPFLKMV